MEQVKKMQKLRQQIIEEINNCRKRPYSYASKIRDIAGYFKGNILKVPETMPIITSEGKKAYEEAARFLENADPLESVKYNAGLTRVAEDALKAIQRLDEMEKIAEVDIDYLLNKHGEVSGMFAQAVDFGSETAELIVINLLVDDGCPERINRENILSKEYKYIGVAAGHHTAYQTSNVIMFTENFKDHGEDRAQEIDDVHRMERILEKKKKEFEGEDKAKKVNVVRRTSVQDTKNFKELSQDKINEKFKNLDLDDDFDLPEGVNKIERNERVVNENGVKKRIVKITKYMEDGSIETEVKKEKL